MSNNSTKKNASKGTKVKEQLLERMMQSLSDFMDKQPPMMPQPPLPPIVIVMQRRKRRGWLRRLLNWIW